MKTYGERLREKRIAAKISQAELAELSETTQQTVQKAEQAKSPSKYNSAFAATLQCNDYELAYGKPHTSKKINEPKAHYGTDIVELINYIEDAKEEDIEKILAIAKTIIKK